MPKLSKLNEQQIMHSSDAAAEAVTVQAWKARGHIYLDERIARFAGCTHVECSKCTLPTPKGWLMCSDCREDSEIEKYTVSDKRPWDGVSAIYSEASDRWFSDADELKEYCSENNIPTLSCASVLRLYHSTPVYAKEVDAYDHFCDDLDEDQDLPDEIEAAFCALNNVIRRYGKPLSYAVGKYAVDAFEDSPRE